ncbi:MAG: sigma-70 family RNA polymerase sigma factor [Bacteroidetes bacterium]|nr:sigma-70 family RNA polymerase sigma factor [Bacteroidota bacterium]
MTQHEYNDTVMTCSDDLYRFVFKSIKNVEDARDIVQHAFEILWVKKDEVEYEKVKSYLFTIGYRKMIDELRRKKHINFKEELPEKLGGTTEIKQTGLKKVLHNALDTLPDIQKQLVILKDYEGYSYEEMAKITGLQDSQVKVYLFRARTSLKKSLISIERNM